MEGNIYDCTLNYKVRYIDYRYHTWQPEFVVITLDQLWDFAPKQSVRSMRREYELIQRLKDIEDELNNLPSEDTSLPTLEEAEEMAIKKHIEQYRPEYPWTEIAEMLGISYQTLKRKRKKYNLM